MKGQTPLDAAAPPRKTLATRDWTIEGIAAAVIIAYMGWWYIGRAQNAAIVTNFVRTFEQYLRSEYSETHSAADDKASSPLQHISDAEVHWWLTGRRNTKGLLMRLALVPRQDASTAVMSAAGQAAVADLLTLEFPLQGTGDGFVFALVPRTDRKELLEANADIKTFATRAAGAEAWGLKDSWDCVTEARDIADAILTRELVTAVMALRGCFRQMHITDVADMSTISVSKMSVRAMRVVLELPPQSQWESALKPFLRALHALVDRLAALKLSKDAAERVRGNRSAYQKQLDKEAAVEAERKKREEREKEKEKEREARAALDRETRKKLEEKERKAAMKSAMPRMKFKSR